MRTLRRGWLLGPAFAVAVAFSAWAQQPSQEGSQPAPVSEAQARCALKCQQPFEKCQKKCGNKGKCVAGCAKSMQSCLESCGIDTRPRE